jgi:DNA-binding MarR family transcriptional regulator
MSAIAYTFNDTVINQRPDDGYVDATAMCQATGKKFNDYQRLKTTQDFLKALSSVTGIPATDLVRSIQGGDSKLQGTWIHPKVAIHLGQWCNPEFAVFVTELVFAWMIGTQHSALSTQAQDPFAHPEVQEFLELLMDADLHRSAMRVLCLVRSAEADGTIDALDYAAIARRLKIHRATSFRVVASLEDAGLLQVQKRRVFRVNPVPSFGALVRRANEASKE